jgi:general secretion pathway protein K
VLLAALVTEFMYETQVEAAYMDGNLRDFEALMAAKSAIANGQSLLASDMLVDILNESGQEALEQDDDALEGGMTFDSFDESWAAGVPFQAVNEAVMQCTIDDEFGKLNLNAIIDPTTQQSDIVLEETLRNLFANRGADGDLDPTDAILDWIDADDTPRANGAEAQDYLDEGLGMSPPTGALNSVESLLMVRGMTPELFFGDPEQEQLPLTELLTVYGDKRGRINANTAEYELLFALGEASGQPGLADIVLEDRETGPYMSENELVQRGLVPPQSAQDTQTNQDEIQVSAPLIVSSRAFRLRGHGLAGNSRVRIEAFVWRNAQSIDAPLRVLRWSVLR